MRRMRLFAAAVLFCLSVACSSNTTSYSVLDHPNSGWKLVFRDESAAQQALKTFQLNSKTGKIPNGIRLLPSLSPEQMQKLATHKTNSWVGANSLKASAHQLAKYWPKDRNGMFIPPWFLGGQNPQQYS